MSFHLELPDTFAHQLHHSSRPLVGMWVSSGSEVCCEIAAGSGFDWVLIDGEHSPYSLETITSLLRAAAAYPATMIVRAPVNDTVLIKQYLDLGVQNLMIPMIDSAEQAEAAVKAMHYPPRGVRGVGSALARSSRWNGVPNYLTSASDTLSLCVQIESAAAVENAAAIAAVDGVDQVFVGPSDLAASMGYIGQQAHPEVTEAVAHVFQAVHDAGKPVGVNAFDLAQARSYLEQGADFAAIGADVQLLATRARALASEFCPPES